MCINVHVLVAVYVRAFVMVYKGDVGGEMSGCESGKLVLSTYRA